MKAVVQRVARACVRVGDAVTGEIGQGLAVLLGVRRGDMAADALWLAEKTVRLRIFEDAAGKMNRSVADVGGAVLVVSQFTLYADTQGGNRPSFILAADPPEAEQRYDEYVGHLRSILGADRVATGVFRAEMQFELVNNGPVTVELTSDIKYPKLPPLATAG